jgi:ribosomal protein L37E
MGHLADPAALGHLANPPTPDGHAMSTAYVECPRCGGRALSVATRCPHCGCDFPPRPLRRSAGQPARAGLRRLLAVVGLLVFGVLLSVMAVRRRAPATHVPATDAPAPPAAPLDTAPASTPPRSVASPDSTAAAVRPSPASPAPNAPPRTEAEAPGSPGFQRYARTWTNVRAGRGNSTPVTRLLQPGAAVLVDSLRRGWYRVRVDGSVVGYVYRTMLALEPTGGRRGR